MTTPQPPAQAPSQTPPAIEAASSNRFLVLPVWLLAIYAIGVLCVDASTICIWIVSAFFFFVLLDPMAEWMKQKRWANVWTAAILVIGASVLILGIAYVFGYLISILFVELEQSKKLFIETFESLSKSWGLWIAKLSGGHAAAPKQGGGNPLSGPMTGEMGGTLLRGLGGAVTAATFSLLTPILAFFFLLERDLLARTLGKAYAKPEDGASTWQKIVKAVRAYFIGNLILAVISYPVFIGLFMLFSVPSLMTVAALATLLNLVPFAGAVLAGFLPAVSLFTQTQTVGASLGLYGCCIAIHFVVADFITPKLLGSQVNINATTSTIALVAWGELWGGIGLILAIPLTAVIKILFEHSGLFWLQWIAGLMSEKVDDSISPTFRPLRSRKK